MRNSGRDDCLESPVVKNQLTISEISANTGSRPITDDYNLAGLAKATPMYQLNN
jgi:hypothetical protein